MSNTTFNSGNFAPYQYSGNSSDSDKKQRMAGDYLKDFSNQSGSNLGNILGYENEDPSTASNRSNSGNSSPSSVSNTSKVMFGNSGKPPEQNTVSSQPIKTPQQSNNSAPPSQSSSSPTMKPPKSGEYYADTAEVKAAWNAEYDEDQYKYYQGKDGVSTGADAYHTDMAKYQAQMLTMGDNPHLQLVNSMMHPDWQDHNYNGTYGQVNQNANYSTAPTGAAYGPGGKKEGMFGNHSGGSKTGQAGASKGKY